MSNCPFCDASVPRVRKAFIRLHDPQTLLPIDQQLVVSERVYKELQRFAQEHQVAIVTGTQNK